MNEKKMDNFKLILKRFVAYLKFAHALSISKDISGAKIEDKFVNFCNNPESNTNLKDLYSNLCKLFKEDKIDITRRFGWGGQGYNGRPILNLIKDISFVEDGQISVSINATFSYKNEACYLHWIGLGGDVSIYPKWERKQDGTDYDILSLKVCLSKDKDNQPQKEIQISDLNKNNDTEVNSFYDCFVSLKKESLSLLLLRAKNIIYTGAPGTGKTYLAKQIADLIGAQYEFVQFHPSYDYTDFVEGLRPVKDSQNSQQIVFERKDGIFKAFCERALKQWLIDQLPNRQFFQSSTTIVGDDLYVKIWTLLNGGKLEEENKKKNKKKNNASLTDEQKNAIEAIKNLIDDIKKRIEEKNKKDKEEGKGRQEEEKTAGEVSIPQGQTNTPKSFVFIIDEINRGEISKIFGELFFSVDPGYRGVDGAVKTQYANLQTTPNLFDLVLMALGKANEGDYGHFFIPENVYIIGTMNDIDRSVESMDFAFRRRFTFIEITAKETQLQILNTLKIANPKKKKNTIDALVEKMDELNKAIYDPDNKSTDNQYDLSEAYHIGAAYFKHYEDYAGQDNAYDKLWDNHLKGVLYEYLRGKPNADETLKKWKNAYSDGMLSLVDLSVDKLKKHISEEEVEDIIGTIELCIRDNIAMGKTQLQNEVLNRFDDAKKSSIKQAWKK